MDHIYWYTDSRIKKKHKAYKSFFTETLFASYSFVNRGIPAMVRTIVCVRERDHWITMGNK